MQSQNTNTISSPKRIPQPLATEGFTERDRERINSYIAKRKRPGSCWIWQGNITNSGYGQIHACGRSHSAHRAVYVMEGGFIPEGMQLDHLCRRRRCVNPAHLEPVSREENIRRTGIAKLKPEQVSDIRDLRATGRTLKSIAEQFGVSESHVSRLVRGRQWRDILPVTTPEVVQ